MCLSYLNATQNYAGSQETEGQSWCIFIFKMYFDSFN